MVLPLEVPITAIYIHVIKKNYYSFKKIIPVQWSSSSGINLYNSNPIQASETAEFFISSRSSKNLQFFMFCILFRASNMDGRFYNAEDLVECNVEIQTDRTIYVYEGHYEEQNTDEQNVDEQQQNFHAANDVPKKIRGIGEKEYVCHMCEKKFNNMSNLTRHMKIHTGEKSFVCDLCNKDFTQSGHLKTHKRIHTGEKPYACMVCNRNFSCKSNLVRHTKFHSGDKPYGCARLVKRRSRT